MSKTNGTSAVLEAMEEELLHNPSTDVITIPFDDTEMEVINIPLKKIKVDTRKFTKEPGLIDSLVSSIREIGLLNPICVVKNDKSGYSLVSGFHRYEAFKKLECLTIPAHILTFDEILGQTTGKTLTRLEENLIRKHFLVYDLAEHLGQCKEIYENLYPQTKQGAASKNKNPKMGCLPAYIDKASEFIGKSRSTTGRYLTIYNDLIKKYPDASKKLRTSEHPILNSLSELMSLSRGGAKISDLVDILVEKQNNKFVSLREAEKRYQERFLYEENLSAKSEPGTDNDLYELLEKEFIRINRSVRRFYETSELKNVIGEPKIERNSQEIVIRFKLNKI